jgi:small multidrug resistance family-3 protein
MASWHAVAILRSTAVFVFSGLLEIGGGWLVWQTVRERHPWWWALIGAAVLGGYGFAQTLQPAAAGEEFGRIDAAYGGVFIAMSFLWGRAVDGMRLDLGDLIGGALCLAGVIVILAWPRTDGQACRCAGAAGESGVGADGVACANITLEPVACNHSRSDLADGSGEIS